MADTPAATEPLERRAQAELGSCCEDLRATVRTITERQRTAAGIVRTHWLGPARDRFDQRMAELDRDRADLAARLSALMARLRDLSG